MRRALIPTALLVLIWACTAPSSNAPPSFTTPTPSPAQSTSAAPTSPATTPSGPTASVTPIPMPNTAQLSVPSGNAVWALVASSRLFVSTDRGATWQDRSGGLDPLAPSREIAFINDKEGWQSTSGSPGMPCAAQWVGIAHTIDGGATWTQLVAAGPPGSADPSGLFGGGCKSRLAFSDAQHGFLSARDANSAPVIYRTTDGGRTWSASRPLPDPPGFTTRGAGVVLDPGRVRAFGATALVVAQGEVNGQAVWYVFRSVDGGASWTHAATLPETQGAFTFVSESRWLQIAQPASSKETTDGGATWHAFTSDYSQAAGVAPTVVFGDPQVGYATVRGAIQRTVDGGAHWTSIKTPGT
jgi:photosystem II stability/assembly factor-like uncharacterized protein